DVCHDANGPVGSTAPINGDNPVASPAFSDTDVTAGTEYTYRVTAVDAVGQESDPSTSVSATPTVPTNTALDFDGSDDHVTFGAAPSLNSNTFTVETWFRRDGPGVAAITTSLGGPSCPEEFLFSIAGVNTANALFSLVARYVIDKPRSGAIQELMKQTEITDKTRDLAAFIAIALQAIAGTIDTSVEAWEKRGYWLKADRFRLEWEWAGRLGAKMMEATKKEDLGTVSITAANITEKLKSVDVRPVPANVHELGCNEGFVILHTVRH
ncbi:MAG: hypothetical protein HGA95_01025, partial [Caldiserica bacterium]|nr:hypothetical protein [Caldisericota bacterium]